MKFVPIKRLLFVLFHVLVLSLALAKDVVIAEYLKADGTFNASYNDAAVTLKPNDVLIYPNGRRFTLGKRLGAGTKDIIFSLQSPNEGKAIRVPGSSHSDGYLDVWIGSQEMLRQAGVPVPEMYEFHPSQYAIIEEIPSLTTLAPNFSKTRAATAEDVIDSLPKDLQAKALGELPTFMGKLARFTEVGDLEGRQLGYSKEKGWYLLDWLYLNMTSHPSRTQTPEWQFSRLGLNGAHRQQPAVIKAVNESFTAPRLINDDAFYEKVSEYAMKRNSSNPDILRAQLKVLAGRAHPSPEVERWVLGKLQVLLDTHRTSPRIDQLGLAIVRDYYGSPDRQIPIPDEARSLLTSANSRATPWSMWEKYIPDALNRSITPICKRVNGESGG